MEWMASPDALDPHPRPFAGAVDLDRLNGVMGTTRVVPALGAHQGRQKPLVKTDATDRKAGHRAGRGAGFRHR